MTNTNAATAILRDYENGPSGMPRVQRLPDAVLECLIDGSLFKYQANAYQGEDRDRLRGLMHDVAEEILARVSLAPVAAIQPDGNEDFPSDLIGRLREYAGNPNYSHGDYADTMRQAADELSRLAASAPAQPEAKGDYLPFDPADINPDGNFGDTVDFAAIVAASLAAPVPAAPADKLGAGPWTHADDVFMLKRQIHNLERHIETYCAPAALIDAASKERGGDAERLDWIEQIVKSKGSFVAMPSGSDMRFIQVRSFAGCENYPTVTGLREAIDAAIATTKAAK